MLRSITYSGTEEPGDTSESHTWGLIRDLLPADAARLLQPSHGEPVLGGGQGWLGERPVAARLLEGPPSPGHEAASGSSREPGGFQHPAVFTAITDDAMAAGMRQVLSGKGLQPSQPALDRLHGIWQGSWERAGAPEAPGAVQQAGAESPSPPVTSPPWPDSGPHFGPEPGGEVDEDRLGRVATAGVARLADFYPGVVDEEVENAPRPSAWRPSANFGPVASGQGPDAAGGGVGAGRRGVQGRGGRRCARWWRP
jgi:hypothetical protein